MILNWFAKYVYENRKSAGLTQKAFAMRLYLRFIRELEQDRPTAQVDKANQVFGVIGMLYTVGRSLMNEFINMCKR